MRCAIEWRGESKNKNKKSQNEFKFRASAVWHHFFKLYLKDERLLELLTSEDSAFQILAPKYEKDL